MTTIQPNVGQAAVHLSPSCCRTGVNQKPKSCTANTGLKDCIDEAVADSSSYYMLGFYVPQPDRKPGWHKLEVKLVNEPGSVRSRTSYYLAPTTVLSDADINRALRDAANARIDYTGIAFGVQPQSGGEAAKAGVLPMRIIVPVGSVLLAPGHPQLSYDIVSVPLTDKGEPAANLRVLHRTGLLVIRGFWAHR